MAEMLESYGMPVCCPKWFESSKPQDPPTSSVTVWEVWLDPDHERRIPVTTCGCEPTEEFVRRAWAYQLSQAGQTDV